MAEAELRVGSIMRVAAALAQDATPALNALGAYFTAQSQAAFRNQRLGNKVWPPRMIPNVPGIVGDLNRGGQPKARRFQGRPALVDTGMLRRSITWRVQGSSSVVVGTNLPYANVHQVGGVTRATVLEPIGKATLREVLSKRPDLGDLGYLFSKPVVVRRVPARPFLGLQPGDREEVERILADLITE